MTNDTNEVNEVKEDDINKALNEIDSLAKEDKEVFRVDTDTFLLSNVEYKLIDNHKEAFDLEMMEERYTDYLLKYDYIVGDIAYEKLRLRGFYEDRRKGVPIDMKISNLEDYLIEYCSFGCAYFVFERSEKKTEDPESYFKRSNKQGANKRRNPRKRNNPKGRKNQPNKGNQGKQGDQNKPQQNQNQKQAQNKQQSPNPKQNQKQKPTRNKQQTQNKKQTQNKPQTQSKNQSSNPNKNKQPKKAKDFQVVKKQEPKATPSTEQKKTVATKKTQNNKKFKIRKKKTDD